MVLMTISGKDCLTKVVPNDDTDIMSLTSRYHLQTSGCTLSSRILRWRTGPVLIRKMTIFGKNCLIRLVLNDDSDIETPFPSLRTTLSYKDQQLKMQDKGSLDREDDHLTVTVTMPPKLIQFIFTKDAPYPSRIHEQKERTGALLMGKMTISVKDCLTKVVPNDDSDIISRHQDAPTVE